MNIFFTSVAHGKLGRLLNEIYMPMNRVLTQRLGPKDYGPGLVKWFLLFIMLPPAFGGPDSPERVRYEKRNKATDLRLHVSNEAFRQADEAGRRALVVECMMRSLDLIEAKKLPDFDIQSLKADVASIAREEGWIA
ncbi:Imm44 family immunity protein [Shinella zoogloeoides]